VLNNTLYFLELYSCLSVKRQALQVPQNQGGVAFFFALEYYSLHIQMGAMEVALEFSIHVAP